MTTPRDPNQPSSTPSSESKPRRPRRRWLFAGGVGLLAAIAGICATRAWAHPGFRRFGGVDSADELREHIGRGADFALWKVDATPEQRKRVDEILDRAAPELFTTMSKGKELRKTVMDAVANGDNAAAESARRQALTWADESSKLWLSTVEQALAVLNSDQRAKVREAMARFGDRHHGPHD